MTSKTGVWRSVASGFALTSAAAWNLFSGSGDAAFFAGIAALWAFLYATRTTQIRETEAQLAAFRKSVGCDDT